MARPLRLEFPGAVYHVTSRGNARQDLGPRKGVGSLFCPAQRGAKDKKGSGVFLNHAPRCGNSRRKRVRRTGKRGRESFSTKQENWMSASLVITHFNQCHTALFQPHLSQPRPHPPLPPPHASPDATRRRTLLITPGHMLCAPLDRS